MGVKFDRLKLDLGEISSSMEIPKIRKNPAILTEAFAKRKLDPGNFNSFLKVDLEWREVKSQIDSFRQRKNKLSLEMNKKREEGVIQEAREVNKRLEDLEYEFEKIERNRNKLMLSLPNILDKSVPVDTAIILGYDGIPRVAAGKVAEFERLNPDLKFAPFNNVKSQYDIIKEYDLTDEEVGSKLSGARFYYKKNELVTLNLALSLYGVKKLTAQGFKQMAPPYLVKSYVEEMATTLDAFEETLYKIEGEDLYMIPSAEHPLAAYNNNKVFTEKELPIRYVGFSTSFRKEAGAHGKETKGIYRNHHFDKVEQYVLCTQTQAEEEINTLIRNQAELLRELNIPVRISLLPSWDMDKKATIQVDVEGWFPSQNKYGELGSHGYLGSWQAARLNIKYMPKGENEPAYVNTIYGTLAATERTLACMLENCIGEDGIIEIPKVLRDYSGIEEIKPKTKSE